MNDLDVEAKAVGQMATLMERLDSEQRGRLILYMADRYKIDRVQPKQTKPFDNRAAFPLKDGASLVVVDTDIISFLFKNHSLAPAYQSILAGRSLAVSLISLAEIEYGMEVKNWGRGRRELMHRFLGRFTALLPDAETAAIWARIKSSCERKRPPDHVRRCLDCRSRCPTQRRW